MEVYFLEGFVRSLLEVSKCCVPVTASLDTHGNINPLTLIKSEVWLILETFSNAYEIERLKKERPESGSRLKFT